MTSCHQLAAKEIDPLLPAYRILLHGASAKEAARRAAAETPPDKAQKRVAPAAPGATGTSNTITTLAQRSDLEDGHAG